MSSASRIEPRPGTASPSRCSVSYDGHEPRAGLLAGVGAGRDPPEVASHGQ